MIFDSEEQAFLQCFYPDNADFQKLKSHTLNSEKSAQKYPLRLHFHPESFMIKRGFKQSTSHMRAYYFLIATFYLFQIGFICQAQQGVVKKLPSTSEASYLLANIKAVNYSFHELHDRSFFVNVFTLNDPRATPKGFFEEHDGILSSILIAIMPDGDYYTESKSFKIEGLENPVITAITEKEYPEFTLSIESGPMEKRKTVEYIFTGDFE